MDQKRAVLVSRLGSSGCRWRPEEVNKRGRADKHSCWRSEPCVSPMDYDGGYRDQADTDTHQISHASQVETIEVNRVKMCQAEMIGIVRH